MNELGIPDVKVSMGYWVMTELLHSMPHAELFHNSSSRQNGMAENMDYEVL